MLLQMFLDGEQRWWKHCLPGRPPGARCRLIPSTDQRADNEPALLRRRREVGIGDSAGSRPHPSTACKWSPVVPRFTPRCRSRSRVLQPDDYHGAPEGQPAAEVPGQGIRWGPARRQAEGVRRGVASTGSRSGDPVQRGRLPWGRALRSRSSQGLVRHHKRVCARYMQFWFRIESSSCKINYVTVVICQNKTDRACNNNLRSTERSWHFTGRSTWTDLPNLIRPLDYPSNNMLFCCPHFDPFFFLPLSGSFWMLKDSSWQWKGKQHG